MKREWQEYLHNALVLSIPTKTDFRGITHREVVLFQGAQGWSEFSPFVEYSDDESLTWLRAAVEAAYFPWPELTNLQVPINATLPRIAPELVKAFLDNFQGVSTIKIKVNSFTEDRDLFLAAHRAMPEAKIRLDVNGLWNYTEAEKNINQFLELTNGCIEYIEQPVASLEDLARLKKNVDVEIAADESIRKDLGGDLSRIKEVADRAIIKWQPSGGISAATQLIHEIGLPTTISSALETSIGISHGLALAASTGNGEIAAGLGTVSLLTQDVIAEPLIVKDGYLIAKRVEVDPSAANGLIANPARQLWWSERIKRVWASIDEEKINKWGWSFL
jgi:O-succinylbenzoate synthase